MDRVGGPSSSPLRHGGPAHLRRPTYESTAQRRAVIGSFSSSEEELGGWEEQQSEWLLLIGSGLLGGGWEAGEVSEGITGGTGPGPCPEPGPCSEPGLMALRGLL